MLKFKKGDTLVEIALAIGVLGFVITAVTITMTSTLSSSEYSLEDTMARNEIDIQAEALRYIHSAYSAQRKLTDDAKEYKDVWRAITAQAVPPSEIPEFSSVGNCDKFYPQDNASSPYNLYKSNAFIINTHRLNTTYTSNPSETNNIIIKAASSVPANSRFQRATVYPRVIYGSPALSDTLLEDSTNISGHLYRAEGIWIQAACSNNSCTKPDYYDFYIRSCWESANDHSSSTISTIVRLHNPDIDVSIDGGITNFTINYYRSNSSAPVISQQASDYGHHYFDIPYSHRLLNASGQPERNADGWRFVGWCLNYVGSYNTCDNADDFYEPGFGSRVLATKEHRDLSMVAVYHQDYSVAYNSGSSAGDVNNMPYSLSGGCNTIFMNHGSCQVVVVPDTEPTRPNYIFAGWQGSDGVLYDKDNRYHTFSSGNLSLTLTAKWYSLYELTYNKNSGSSTVNSMPTPNPASATTCNASGCSIQISASQPRRAGYIFLGWSTNPGAAQADTTYSPGNFITLTRNLTLYAVWLTSTNSEWGIAVSWTSGCSDIDSHTYLYNESGAQLGHIYYGNKTGTFTGGTKISLDHDYTSPGYTETTTIDNLGSNTIYFCAHCYSGSTYFNSGGLRVTVSSPEHNNYYENFTATSASSATDWTVFRIRGDAYGNAVVTKKNTLGCSVGW